MKRALLKMLDWYQRWISPAFPRRCKYEPTCSSYAAEAIQVFGPLRGSVLSAWRLLRCNPLSNGGIDDVADQKLFDQHACGRGSSEVEASLDRVGATVR